MYANKITVCSIAFFLGASLCLNAQVKEDFVPSSKNQTGREYPMVNSEGYARFRVEAPEAQSVVVTLGLGGQGGTKLEKQADGSWTGTTAGPMDEGFTYYPVIVVPLGERYRNSGPRQGFLRPEECASRQCAAGVVPLAEYGYGTSCFRLYPGRIRQDRQALSCALSSARMGRG